MKEEEKRITEQEFEQAVHNLFRAYARDFHKGTKSLVDGFRSAEYFADLQIKLFHPEDDDYKDEDEDETDEFIIHASSPAEAKKALKDIMDKIFPDKEE